jgi:hypothetical protein
MLEAYLPPQVESDMSNVDQMIIVFIAALCAVVIGINTTWLAAPLGFVLSTAFLTWVIEEDSSP